MDNLKSWFTEHGFNTVQEGAEQLTEDLGISVKEYDEGVFVLNYSQINSPKTDPVVIECRGLIVDNDLNPVCRPFDRFFNLGEVPEITESFDFEDATFYEKADGSLVKMYHHNDRWHVATRGTAFAESANYTGETFENLILEAFGCADMDELQEKAEILPKAYTHIFEYTSPKNRIVTPYTASGMVLLGVRKNNTGVDATDHNMLNVVADLLAREGLNVRAAESHTFASKEELLEAVQALPGLQEGFVGVDKNGTRVKIKSDLYVQVHKLRGDSIPTPKRIAELVVTNETEEYLAYFPEDKDMFQPYSDSLVTMLEEAENLYNRTVSFESQKDFALAVKDTCYSGLLFGARKNGSDVREEFMDAPVGKRAKMFLTYKDS